MATSMVKTTIVVVIVYIIGSIVSYFWVLPPEPFHDHRIYYPPIVAIIGLGIASGWVLTTKFPTIYRYDVIFILSCTSGVVFFVVLIIAPVTIPYSFQTVTKVSGYDEPIYLTFHWQTEDELMVGKLIKVWVEARGLPYEVRDNMQTNMTIQFNQLNYFSNVYDVEHNKISEVDTVLFEADAANNVLKTSPIFIRYIVPVDVSVTLCDRNQQKGCAEISQIIHPAPHDTFVQIDTTRTNAGVSIIVAIFTVVTIWFNTRNRNKNTSCRPLSSKESKIVFLLLVVMPIIGYLVSYGYLMSIGDAS